VRPWWANVLFLVLLKVDERVILLWILQLLLNLFLVAIVAFVASVGIVVVG
jgi:hypothetical protein